MATKKKTEKRKLPKQYRGLGVVESREEEGKAIDVDARTVRVAFSSETPVERYWGKEILGHGEGEVDLSRMEDGRAPVLDGHDTRAQIGVVEEVEFGSDRVGRALLRFGKSARAEEVFQDIADRIRSQVSVGYRINKMVLEEAEEDSETYRATNWSPMEISIVSIAADYAVGVGREEEDTYEALVTRTVEETEEERTTTVEVKDMDEETRKKQEEELAKIRKEAGKKEAARVRDLMAAGALWDCEEDATRAIDEGTSVADFKSWILEKKAKREPVKRPEKPETDLDLSKEEVRSYSLVRAIQSFLDPKAWARDNSLEREASEEIAKRLGRDPNGFFVPYDVVRAPVAEDETIAKAVLDKLGLRAEAVSKTLGTTPGAGIVATDLLVGSFIDLLRNRSIVGQMGATVLGGLVGDVDVPRQSAGAAAAWLSAEHGDAAEGNLVTDTVSLTPKTLAVFTVITRRMLKQGTPDIEALVRADLAMAIALGVDVAAINGSGASGEPEGVLNASGIGSVTSGGVLSWAEVVELETDVASANADLGSLGYITNAHVAGLLKTTPKESGQAVYLMGEDGRMNGYAVGRSNQVPNDLGVGTDKSAIIFGNWADLLIGEWGVMDMLPDPYTLGKKGALQLNAFQDVDVALRHAESFSAAVDVT